MVRHLFACALLPLALVFTLASCGDPPDDTPLGREVAASMVRPEQKVDHVKLQHVLIAFVGAMRGSESGHTFDEARALALDVLTRARAGEDFAGLVKKYSNDDGDGIYTLTQDDRSTYAKSFGDVAFRLAPGEIGIAGYQPSKSPFGWHIIKRLE